MTKVLNQLVEDEWVSRIADVDDSRAWLIQITAKGRRALTDWRAELARAMEPMFSGVSEADWLTLARAAEILETRTQSSEAVA